MCANHAIDPDPATPSREEQALRFIRGTLEGLDAGRGTPTGALFEILLTARSGLPVDGAVKKPSSDPAAQRETAAASDPAPAAESRKYPEGMTYRVRRNSAGVVGIRCEWNDETAALQGDLWRVPDIAGATWEYKITRLVLVPRTLPRPIVAVGNLYACRRTAERAFLRLFANVVDGVAHYHRHRAHRHARRTAAAEKGAAR